MRLADAITNINYDAGWEIYAEFPLTPDSDCRYGQRIFENGGLLDEKTYVINGESANDRVQEMIDYSILEYCSEDDQRAEAVEILIEELNSESCKKCNVLEADCLC